MRDVILRLVARVSEVEYDAVDGPTGRLRLDREERKALNSKEGKALQRKVTGLLLRLHARHRFTDAAATDGSKAAAEAAEHTTVREGPTAFGIWEGAQYEGRDEERQQWVDRLRRGRGPTTTEVNEAAQAGVHAGRIGDAATVLDAELYAIYMFLKRVAMRPRPRARRVLVVSDSLCYW